MKSFFGPFCEFTHEYNGKIAVRPSAVLRGEGDGRPEFWRQAIEKIDSAPENPGLSSRSVRTRAAKDDEMFGVTPSRGIRSRDASSDRETPGKSAATY